MLVSQAASCYTGYMAYGIDDWESNELDEHFRQMALQAEPYHKVWNEFVASTRSMIYEINADHAGLPYDSTNTSLLSEIYPYDATVFKDALEKSILTGLSQPLKLRHAYAGLLYEWSDLTNARIANIVSNRDIFWRQRFDAENTLHLRRYPKKIWQTTNANTLKSINKALINFCNVISLLPAAPEDISDYDVESVAYVAEHLSLVMPRWFKLYQRLLKPSSV